MNELAIVPGDVRLNAFFFNFKEEKKILKKKYLKKTMSNFLKSPMVLPGHPLVPQQISAHSVQPFGQL